MNHGQHEDFAHIAALRYGIADTDSVNLLKGAAGCDYVQDVSFSPAVACDVADRFGCPTAFQHFQRKSDGGYCWEFDPSLPFLGTAGAIAMELARVHVRGTSRPMINACIYQTATLDAFRFPPASALASWYSTAPALSEENGRALHLVEDCCVPHHAWGALELGHQKFEDALEAVWNQQRAMAETSPEAKAAFLKLLNGEIAKHTITGRTVEELCRENAAWALDCFGQPHRLEECPWDVALPVCARAIASTMRGLEIMKGA